MAKFEGVEWAPHHSQYLIQKKEHQLLDMDPKTFFLVLFITVYFRCFEGIRFFVSQDGRFKFHFVNLDHNLRRFRSGILYSISPSDKNFVPTEEGLREIFSEWIFRRRMRPFLKNMADNKAQGYFRPFTLDRFNRLV